MSIALVEVQVLFRAPKKIETTWSLFSLVALRVDLNRRSRTASGSLSFTCVTDEIAWLFEEYIIFSPLSRTEIISPKS